MTQIKPVTGTLRIIIYGAGAIGGVLGAGDDGARDAVADAVLHAHLAHPARRIAPAAARHAVGSFRVKTLVQSQ